MWARACGSEFPSSTTRWRVPSSGGEARPGLRKSPSPSAEKCGRAHNVRASTSWTLLPSSTSTATSDSGACRSWPLQRLVADEARALGLPVVGHGVGLEEIIRSVTLGYWTLEHLISVHDDVHQMLAAAGTRATPTLALGGTTQLMLDEPERLADPKLRAFVPGWWMREAPRVTRTLPDPITFRAVLADRLASIRAAHAAGVSLQIGTDSQRGVRLLFYGAALGARELCRGQHPATRGATYRHARGCCGRRSRGRSRHAGSRQARRHRAARCQPVGGHQEHTDHLAGAQGRVGVRSGRVAAAP